MERISPQALEEEMLRGEVMVLDVRGEHSYENCDERIPGDERRAPDRIDEWWSSLPKGLHLVTY